MDETEKLKELNANMRFYADMRFKQLTLFMAWLTLALGGVTQSGEKIILDGITLQVIVAFASILFVSVLWIMEVRSTLYWVAHRDEGTETWPSPKDLRIKWLDATNAVFLLYLSVFGFWLYGFSIWSQKPWLTILGVGLYTILILFTVLNYIPLWRHRDKNT